VVRFVPIAIALSILWAEIGAVNAAPAFLVGVNNNLSNIAAQNPVDKVSGASKKVREAWSIEYETFGFNIFPDNRAAAARSDSAVVGAVIDLHQF
jgi:hypothetical protein